MAYMDYQIRKLPYGIHRALAIILDSPGNMDWRALISAIPGNPYGPYEVAAFERVVMSNHSPTEALLQDLGQKCKTVKQLVSYLKKIGNSDALDVLGYHEPVTILEQPKSHPVQEGTQAILKFRASGCPAPSYQWLKDGIELPDGVDSELVLDPVRLSDHGNYTCIVSNRMNTEKTNVVELQVLPGSRAVNGYSTSADFTPQATNPPLILRQPQSGIVHVGQPFQLNVDAIGPAAFQWYKDSCRLPSDLQSPVLDFQPFQYHHEGNYTCRVYNSKGDTLSNVATLRAHSVASGLYDSTYLPQGFAMEGSTRPDGLNQTATDKIALVIGNRDYMHLPVEEHPLVHTCNDAKQLASMLRKPQMGFKVISLINLTKEEMEKAVEIFCSLLGEGVYGLVYFAGHGFEQDGQNYLVPIDAEGEWTPKQAVCVQKILEQMAGTNVELNVFLLDVCRKSTYPENPFVMERYQFPCNAQVVLGFATCPQAEAFERRCDPNGFYMKQLLPLVMNEEKVEDLLHKVTGAVAEEIQMEDNMDLQMRPQFHSTTTRAYSLRDPILTDARSDGRRSSWLDIHKLPQKRTIKYDYDITVEIRFEHKNWLSNVIVLCLRVVNLGEANFCDACLKLDALPLDVQKYHFHETTANVLRQVVRSNDAVARSCPSSKTNEPTPIPVERISEIYNIQRLKHPLTLTIEVKFAQNGATEGQQPMQTRYTVKAFGCKEFGISNAFMG